MVKAETKNSSDVCVASAASTAILRYRIQTGMPPPGVLAASVGFNAMKNACLLAARIVAASDDELTTKLEAYAAKEAQKVRNSRKKLENLPAAPAEAY